jgi:hypothetical protein
MKIKKEENDFSIKMEGNFWKKKRKKKWKKKWKKKMEEKNGKKKGRKKGRKRRKKEEGGTNNLSM